MKHGIPVIVTVAAAVTLATLSWLGDLESGRSPARETISGERSLGKHLVTPDQLLGCGALAERRIEPFTATTHDGTRFTWPAAVASRPLVLVFIKRGCPCSVEFEPYFHRLEERYRDVAGFVGVIDGDETVAREYAVANEVPYRIIADPDRAIITRFEARHGGYVALLGEDGRLDTLWPGCSAEMMRELGRRIATRRTLAERPFDVSDMPKVLTTGCPYAS